MCWLVDGSFRIRKREIRGINERQTILVQNISQNIRRWIDKFYSCSVNIFIFISCSASEWQKRRIEWNVLGANEFRFVNMMRAEVKNGTKLNEIERATRRWYMVWIIYFEVDRCVIIWSRFEQASVVIYEMRWTQCYFIKTILGIGGRVLLIFLCLCMCVLAFVIVAW